MRRLLIATHGAWARRNASTLLALSGVAAGVATASAVMSFPLYMSGVAAGVAVAAATMAGALAMSGSSSGSASASATMTITWVISYGSMTFSRSSQGSYYTSAPTGGSPAFIGVASTDVLRTDNRGDGAGGLTLLEGARANSALYGRDVTNNYWTKTGTQTLDDDAGTGPDGNSNADRANMNSGCQIYRTGLGGGCLSTYVRGYSGGSQRLNVGFDGTVAVGSASISTTWTRLACFSSGSPTYALLETIDRSGVGGVGAGASDVLIDFVQHESGRFPSTPIGTNGSALTRSADTLTLTSGSVPAPLFTGKGRFTQLSPLFANTDLASGDVFWLLSIGGSSNGIRIRHDGANVVVEAVASGSVVATSQALTFARDALLGAIAWDPAGGVVYVNGVAGVAGTPWSWSSGNIRVGGIHGGAGEAFCRFGALESWA